MEGHPEGRTVSGIRSAIVGLAVIAATLATGVQPAQAAGFVYVKTAIGEVPIGGVTTKTAKCPSDTHVVSGGVEITDSNTATGVAQSYPVDTGDKDSKPDDGWRGIVASRSAGLKHMRTWAVCAGAGKFIYVTNAAANIDPGDTTADNALCPDGSFATGGGASNGDFGNTSTIVRTYPEDDFTDGDVAPDDLWRTRVRNGAAFNISMVAYAVCARQGLYDYPTSEISIQPGQQGIRVAACLGGSKAIGGGMFTSDETAGSFPYDDADTGNTPDDGWVGVANNHDATPQNIETYAVCKT